VVTQLIQHSPASIVVGGTSDARFKSSRKRWIDQFPAYEEELLKKVNFVAVDRERPESVAAAFDNDGNDIDLVVHAAGPFQGKVKCPNGVLEACVTASIMYIDVCDDYCTASAAKTKYAARAQAPCILSTGCWPGVSSLMAKQLVSKTLSTYPSLKPEDLSVDFSFFTAG